MALTVKGIGTLTEPGRYADRDGLYLHVTHGKPKLDDDGKPLPPKVRKSWVQRLVIDKVGRIERGLGSVNLVSLAEARELAHENRRAARRGENPFGPGRGKRGASPETLTFQQAAQHALDHVRGTLAPKTAADWLSPVIGIAPRGWIARSRRSRNWRCSACSCRSGPTSTTRRASSVKSSPDLRVGIRERPLQGKRGEWRA